MTADLLGRAEFDAASLLRDYPPRFQHAHKRLLFERIPPLRPAPIQVSRWQGRLPERVQVAKAPQIEMRETVFSYEAPAPGTVAWHVNFADPALFGFYAGPLLAQDEHQVLEHPVLASVREALLDLQTARPELAPRTREYGATPVLIKGAQRSIHFDTVRGPYGNAFARENPATVLEAATFLEEPTFSNILAMAGPHPAFGRYTTQQIREALETAYIGFSACKAESAGAHTLVHTGKWGCGAFGGNAVLMVLLQLCAATFAGLDSVLFYTVDPTGTRALEEAQVLAKQLLADSEIDVTGLIDAVFALGFEWGQPDGN